MDNSPFVLLSPELRNIIWEYVFRTSLGNTHTVTLLDGSIFWPLTRTCRQIRYETLAMHLSLTTFNAHFNDGPSTPLAIWLTTLGPERVLQLREIKIWGLHDLDGTLHGAHATRRALQCGVDGSSSCVLQPVRSQYYEWHRWLGELETTLKVMGLGLAQLCKVAENGIVLGTSRWAIVESGDVRSTVDEQLRSPDLSTASRELPSS